MSVFTTALKTLLNLKLSQLHNSSPIQKLTIQENVHNFTKHAQLHKRPQAQKTVKNVHKLRKCWLHTGVHKLRKRSQLHKMLAQLPKILQAQKMLTTSQAQKTFTTSKFSQAQKCGLQHYFRTLAMV